MDDGRSKNNPSSPAQMRDKQQDIDEESEEGDQEGREQEDQQGQEISRRMRRAMEVSGGSQAQANEGEKGGNGMDDQNGRERFAGAGGKIEVVSSSRQIVWGIDQQGDRLNARGGNPLDVYPM